MGKRFNYGVYGVGRIGKVHVSIVQKQGHKIIAIGDDVQAAVLAAQEELDLASIKTFNNAEDMVRGAAHEMDAVIIASHTKDHAKDALPFVKAGIPVYLEKPLTDGLKEAFDFVEAIGRDEHLIQIGLQRRFDPPLLHAKALLDSGLIGAIREIRCILRDQYPPPPTYSSRGLIIDMGIHVADEAIFFLSEFPNEVWASVHHTKGYNSPIDEGGDTAFVTFTTPSNILGRLDLSRTHSSGYNNETYIIGTEGTLQVGRFAGYPGPIYVELWKSDGTQHSSSKSFEMSYLKGDYPEFLPRFDKAYRNAHRQFRDVVETSRSFAVTQNHVLDAQVFVEAAHRSAQDNGLHYKIRRFDDLQQYKMTCIASNLMDCD
ncbi:MAG: Gfo/Idh/MocA family oxidoreductase [Anaerolineaceae bacterium]|nr:MAG: Gfo/Idh/MocA family oxidoreductase [Anaerolineaceae bacterium]